VIWIKRRLRLLPDTFCRFPFRPLDVNTLDNRVTLYERVGGANGIRGIIDRFYARVFVDPKLKPYFIGVPTDKLRHMQSEFFSAALGGPVHYSGRTIVQAHQGRKITRLDLQAFVEHLFETLKEHALDDEDRYAIIARINTYADEVISGGVGLDT